MIKIFKILLTCISLFVSSTSFAETINCRYRKIIDGNTVICEAGKNKHIKIKLYQIDAPNLGQPYGYEAKEYLDNFLMRRGGNVVAIIKGKDKNQNLLASVESYVESFGPPDKPGGTPDMSWGIKDINLQMIKRGYAWYTPPTGEKPDPKYQKAQEDAKQIKNGLWSQPNPVPPWKWRRLQTIYETIL